MTEPLTPPATYEHRPDPTNTSADPDVVVVRESRGVGVIIGSVVLVLAAVATLILVAQNTSRVSLHFLWGQLDVPLAVLVLGSFVLGVIVSECVGVIWRRKRRKVLDLKSGT